MNGIHKNGYFSTKYVDDIAIKISISLKRNSQNITEDNNSKTYLFWYIVKFTEVFDMKYSIIGFILYTQYMWEVSSDVHVLCVCMKIYYNLKIYKYKFSTFTNLR